MGTGLELALVAGGLVLLVALLQAGPVMREKIAAAGLTLTGAAGLFLAFAGAQQ